MSHDNQLSEEELARRARAGLELQELSPEVQSRLRSARAQAVERLAQREDRAGITASLRQRLLIPAGALGAAGVLSVAWLMSQQAAPDMPVLDEQEFAALTEMELLDEIEFLAWMMEQPDGPVPDEG